MSILFSSRVHWVTVADNRICIAEALDSIGRVASVSRISLQNDVESDLVAIHGQAILQDIESSAKETAIALAEDNVGKVGDSNSICKVSESSVAGDGTVALTSGSSLGKVGK